LVVARSVSLRFSKLAAQAPSSLRRLYAVRGAFYKTLMAVSNLFLNFFPPKFQMDRLRAGR
jgi:hypothetical protein